MKSWNTLDLKPMEPLMQGRFIFQLFYGVTDNTWPFDDKQSSYIYISIDYLIVFSSRVLDHGQSIYHDRVNYRVMEKLTSFGVFYRKFGEKKHMNEDEVAWVISWNMYEHFGFMTYILTSFC